MTKNPFEEFWKKWDTTMINTPYLLDHLDWEQLKKEFFSLCEKQAKKAEKIMIEHNGKEFWFNCENCTTAYGEIKVFRLAQGKETLDFLRLMQGTAQNNSKEKKIMVLRGKKNRAKQLVQGGLQKPTSGQEPRILHLVQGGERKTRIQSEKPYHAFSSKLGAFSSPTKTAFLPKKAGEKTKKKVK